MVNNDDAFPQAWLYLDLHHEPLLSDSEDQRGHGFSFQTKTKTELDVAEPGRWFLCADILGLTDEESVHKQVTSGGLEAKHPGAEVLLGLFRAVHVDKHVWAFTESSQDSDVVLEIFVRMNSGGTPLSKSDLLMSMARNQWTGDARKKVDDLVVRLNGPDKKPDFHFSRDFVLKAALYLSSATDFRFRLSNFSKTNMVSLEAGWTAISKNLMNARDLLLRFGFNGQNLHSENVLLPVALYMQVRGLSENYLTLTGFGTDRALARLWVTRSLIKRGVWSAGQDTLLRHLRTVIKQEGSNGFPYLQIEHQMAAMDKPLSFSEADIDALLNLTYNDRRTYAVLTTVFGSDNTSQLHVDHIFPSAHMTEGQLRKAGVTDAAEIRECLKNAQLAANLQLFEGALNTSKQAREPHEWLNEQFPHLPDRAQFIQRNLLGEVPADLSGFLECCKVRRAALRARLRQQLQPDDGL